jgi:hypothetical protein
MKLILATIAFFYAISGMGGAACIAMHIAGLPPGAPWGDWALLGGFLFLGGLLLLGVAWLLAGPRSRQAPDDEEEVQQAPAISSAFAYLLGAIAIITGVVVVWIL